VIRPPYLKSGDKIAIVATAKKLEPGQIDGAMREMQSWGLGIVCGPNLYVSDRQFAGTDAQRAADLQWAIDDPQIKAVIFARGGYGTSRILDLIQWSNLLKHPKWLCGFSDLTALHCHVHQHLGMETMHSTMPIFFKDGMPNVGSESLRKSLFGLAQQTRWPAHELNRSGVASGELIGGNLSVLCSLMGSKSEVDFSGKILFLEDLTEYYYHLDRMMIQLKRAGKLQGLAALVVGQFTEMMDNPVPFGKSTEQIILDAVSDAHFPVVFNAPVGHVDKNETMVCGANVELRCSGNQVFLTSLKG